MARLNIIQQLGLDEETWRVARIGTSKKRNDTYKYFQQIELKKGEAGLFYCCWTCFDVVKISEKANGNTKKLTNHIGRHLPNELMALLRGQHEVLQLTDIVRAHEGSILDSRSVLLPGKGRDTSMLTVEPPRTVGSVAVEAPLQPPPQKMTTLRLNSHKRR